MSEWIAQSGQSVARLSRDDDNDINRFLAYLIAALQTYQGDLGATVLALLTTPQTPPPKTVLTLLINELGARSTPLTLILDDYHLISALPIHEALTFFIPTLHPLPYHIHPTPISFDGSQPCWLTSILLAAM